MNITIATATATNDLKTHHIMFMALIETHDL